MNSPQLIAGWSQLSDLFDRALELQGEARADFVAHGCGDNSELREALDKLLAADDEAGPFMEEPLLLRRGSWGPLSENVAAPGADRHPAPPLADGRFGPYRVLREVGQGGMSTVYLAVRDDDTFERRVVVKLVRSDLIDADLERRLRTERHILASLNHPNIARLFDGGTTEDGRSYFVMEYVEGLPIHTFADLHQLSIDERLSLFRKVLGAVQYAHQNLIVHRDLKPSNILVSASGEPKLLDFGIAKLLNPELATDEVHATASWLRLMTPHYASPEQARGDLVGTTSDIYSLGVLLYQLLTGRLPFDFSGATAGEIERILTEHDPPRPSLVVTTVSNTASSAASNTASEPSCEEIARARSLDVQELRRHLAGDLDAIVLKALRSAPQRRYGSADRFADDVLRYQRKLPVDARQGSWRYRVGKLIRRHRAATFAIAGFALALTLGLATFASEHAKVKRQRDVATLERQQRETVLALLVDVLQVADPHLSGGEEFTVREALDASAPKLRQQLANQPALRAELLFTTGRIYHNLGLWARARVDLEEALALHRGLAGDNADSLARTQSELAVVLANLDELEEAKRLSQQATTSARDARGRLPASRIDLLNNQVTVLCAAHDYQTALPLAIEALAVARTSTDSDNLATALVNRGMVALRHGENDQASEWFRQAIHLLTLRWGAGHPRLASPLSNFGSARRRSGDLAGARTAFEQAIAIQRAALGDDHPLLAITLNNLAGVYAAQGEHQRAIDLFGQAATVLAGQVGADHPRLFFLQIQIAQSRIAAGQAKETVQSLGTSLAQWRERLGENHRFVLQAEQTLGRALTETGAYERAERLLASSLSRARATHLDREAKTSLEDLRDLYTAMGSPEKMAAYEPLLAEE